MVKVLLKANLYRYIAFRDKYAFSNLVLLLHYHKSTLEFDINLFVKVWLYLGFK